MENLLHVVVKYLKGWLALHGQINGESLHVRNTSEPSNIYNGASSVFVSSAFFCPSSLRWGRRCHLPPWPGCRPACGPKQIGPPSRWSGSDGPCWCRPSGSSSSQTEREETGRLRTAMTWTPSAWWRKAAETSFLTWTCFKNLNFWLRHPVWINSPPLCWQCSFSLRCGIHSCCRLLLLHLLLLPPPWFGWFWGAGLN